MPSQTAVYDALRGVIDPELGINIVDLGLVYQVAVDEPPIPGKPFIHITMTLTTPGCPLAGMFDRMVRDELAKIPGVQPEKDAQITLTFDPPWVTDMMSEEAKAELGF